MADPVIVSVAAAASFSIALIGTGLLSRILARRGILDLPNQRSSHKRATPRGGGIAVIAAILAGFGILILAGQPLPAGFGTVIVVTVALASVSWVDDVRGLPAAARFGLQAVCVGASLYLLPLPIPALIGGLPDWAQATIMGVAWLWFINLYNFMDGIDGITGIETLVISLGVAVVLQAGSGGYALIAPALIIAAAMPGFLKWNWPPAKIFMGDVGSVALGYLLGWLLLASTSGGSTLAAVIIAGYYVADATITLFRRAFRGERVWRAHREHAYQKALQNGMTHGMVSMRIGILGIVLIALALLSFDYPLAAALTAVVIVGAVLHHFTRQRT